LVVKLSASQNPVGNADMNNVAVGYQAALCTTTGIQNTAVAACSLRLNTTGAFNSAVGFLSLANNTSGCNNVAVGGTALFCNTTGGCNTAIGLSALCANVEGDQSVAIGNDALRPRRQRRMNNVAVGYQAALVYDDGVNTAVGALALQLNTTAYQQQRF
jgi:trimeric autotransporter adhesin